jgi:hypothetical protein
MGSESIRSTTKCVLRRKEGRKERKKERKEEESLFLVSVQ